MGNPGEWLDPIELRETRRSLEFGPDAPVELVLKGIVEKYTAPNGVFAVRVMWSQLEYVMTEMRGDDSGLRGLSDLEIISMVFPNPHFIHLTRRELVAQAISYSRAISSDKWLESGQKTEPTKGSEVDFNYFLFNHCLTSLRDGDRNWRHFLSAGNPPVLELEVEQITQDYHGTLESIGAFLGVNQRLSIDPALNGLKEMRDATSARLIRQCEETLAGIEQAESEGIIAPNPPDACRSKIVVSEHPETVRPDQIFEVRLEITNTSEHIWPAIGKADGDLWNCVTSTWYQGSEKIPVGVEFPAPLPHDMTSGETAQINLPIFAPDRPGTYRLEVGFAQTGVDRPREDGWEPTILTTEVRHDPPIVEALLYFQEKDVDPEGWIWTDWLGSIRTINFPWVYCSFFGWLFCPPRSPDKKGYWFSRKDLGWLWTNPKSAPYFWSAERKEWLCDELKKHD